MFINEILVRFMRDSFKIVSKSIVIQLVLTLTASCITMLISAMIRKLFAESPRPLSLVLILFAVIVLYSLIYFLSKIKTRCAEEAGRQIKGNVRSKLMQKLFLLGPAFTSEQRTGTLASTLTTQVEWLKYYYTQYLPVAASSIINALIFIILIYRMDPWTSLIVLIAVLAMLLTPMTFFSLMRKRGRVEWLAHAAYYSECLDSIQGLDSLKALNALEKQKDQLQNAGEKHRKAIMSHLRVTMLEGAFLEFFARVGSAFSIAFLALRYHFSLVSINILIPSFFCISAAFVPMMSLINAWHLGFQGISASYEIQELLDKTASHSLKGQFLPPEPVGQKEIERYLNTECINSKNSILTTNRKAPLNAVEFKAVTFSYDSIAAMPTVKKINLIIPAHKMVALVGHSGSGKSTLAHLLSGFYACKVGEIKVQSLSLNDSTVDVIRSQIAAVWQDSHLFFGSIRENLLMGKPDASQEELDAALRKAQLYDFVMSLPEKYETLIGERGNRMSGGEKQRMTIARALLRNCPILILDEASSSLDRQNEKLIQTAIKEIVKSKSVLVIAHRQSTIQQADLIYVLKRGQIVDCGKHEELLQRSEEYQKIMNQKESAHVR